MTDLKKLKRGLAAEKRSHVKIERRGNDPTRGIASAAGEAFAGKKRKQTKVERKEYNRLYWQRYSARKKAGRKAADYPFRASLLEKLRRRAAELSTELEEVKAAIRVIEKL